MRILIMSVAMSYDTIITGLQKYLTGLGHEICFSTYFKEGYDFVLSIGDAPLTDECLQNFSGKRVHWNITRPRLPQPSCPIVESYSVYDGTVYCCPNPDVHIRTHVNKKYDVFVGGFPTEKRQKLISSLSDNNLVVCTRSGCIPPQELIGIINESKIILNLSHNEYNDYDPIQLCDCLATGGFLIVEKALKYPDGLKEGRDFVSCSYDCIVKEALYFLKYQGEISRVSNSGYRHMWKNFKWEDEWAKIDALVNQSKFLGGRNYFFILGSQRSGTTLMELMLDSHPEISVFGEPGAYEKLINKNSDPLDKTLGFKIPMWTHKVEELKRDFPNAKILFMNRDIRAIVSSMVRLEPWIKTQMSKEMESALSGVDDDYIRSTIKNLYDNSTDIVEKATLCAYTKQMYGYTYRANLPTMTVDYESLVCYPEGKLCQILIFLGLPWHENVLKHHELHKGLYAGSTDSQKPVDKSCAEKWRSNLTLNQVRTIMKTAMILDNIAGYKMSGYELICPVCDGKEFSSYPGCPAYMICGNCGLYQQWPMPSRVYEGPGENFGMGPGTGHLMSDSDKEANRSLAEALYSLFKPGSVLDIGSKYPYFLSILKDRCDVLGIDGIDQVIEYGKLLGVKTAQIDIETTDIEKCKYDLITLTHVLEHFHSPVLTMKRILRYLTNKGTLFIRTPDPDVQGIERDLTDHHLSIHPFLFTKKSLEKLLSGSGFEIFRHDRIDGHGQSDYYIRKKSDKPLISFCMIVRNESKNVTDCLESVKGIVQEIIVVDTGSDDDTKEVISRYTDKIYDHKWMDNFSEARNHSLSLATGEWLLWGDADDIFENPEQILEEIKDGHDAYNANILYGNDVFCHARLFKNKMGVHFSGWVHEFPVIENLKFKEHTGINIRHKTEKHVTENRTLRNYRILRKWLEAEPENSRALFYLGCTLKELGQGDQAIQAFNKYLIVASWRDEMFMAQKYIGRIYQGRKQYNQAIKEYLKALAIDDRWAEAYYYIGECYYYLGDYKKCIGWMKMAAATPDNASTLFKEIKIYGDLPYRYLFACYEILGDFHRALDSVEGALKKNPEDDWLKQRREHFLKIIDDLCQKPDPTKEYYQEAMVIECYRQGALGDCLMTTAALRGLKDIYPNSLIRFVTNPKSVPILEGNKYIDELVTDPGSHADKKVYFCYPDKGSVLKDEGYPNKPLSRHIVQIFNECAGISDTLMALECTLSEKEDRLGRDMPVRYGNYVSLHTKAGWSPYKEWPMDRWESVVKYINSLEYKVLLIGSKGDPLVEGCIDCRGLTVKESVSIIKYADIHIGIDSFSNHAAHAVCTPAIILFGSTSPVGSGYEENINIWKGCDCSPCYREYEWSPGYRGKCPHGHRCMMDITVEEVIDIIRKFK